MQDIDFDRGVWAVVSTHGFGLVIGRIASHEALTAEAVSAALIESIARGIPVMIDPAFGFSSDTITVNTPDGPGMTLLRQCAPLANCVSAAKLHTQITGAVLFTEMDKEDQRRHKRLVEQLLEQLEHARMRALGLHPATRGVPGEHPGQP